MTRDQQNWFYFYAVVFIVLLWELRGLKVRTPALGILVAAFIVMMALDLKRKAQIKDDAIVVSNTCIEPSTRPMCAAQLDIFGEDVFRAAAKRVLGLGPLAVQGRLEVINLMSKAFHQG